MTAKHSSTRSWEVTLSTETEPKLTIRRAAGGDPIMLQIDHVGSGTILAADTETEDRWRLLEAVATLRTALKSHSRAQHFHAGKITWTHLVGERRIFFEIDAPRIRSKGEIQRAVVHRKIQRALDAIEAAVPSLPLGKGISQG